MRWLRRILRWFLEEPAPCYRCGIKLSGAARQEFAGYKYCPMCRDVVAAMNHVVAHDPPYGFPGAKGYS